MAGEIIRLGDKTSHGGTVLEGSMMDICHGKPIAYIGHKVHCPKCKGTYPIAEGVMTTSFYGKGVAVAGMKTACGATLIASQFTDIVETGGGGGSGGGSADAGSQAEAAPLAAAAVAAPAAAGPGNAAAGGSGTVPANEKKITAVSWSYGQDETPISGVSRFYVDLNVHVETENYAPGETVNLTIADSNSRDVLVGVKEIALRATVGADGKGKLLNVFAGKTVINYGDAD